MSVEWQFIILLIYISLIIKEVEHLFMFAGYLVSSSVNFLFISFAVKSYWFTGLKKKIHILDINSITKHLR